MQIKALCNKKHDNNVRSVPYLLLHHALLRAKRPTAPLTPLALYNPHPTAHQLPAHTHIPHHIHISPTRTQGHGTAKPSPEANLRAVYDAAMSKIGVARKHAAELGESPSAAGQDALQAALKSFEDAEQYLRDWGLSLLSSSGAGGGKKGPSGKEEQQQQEGDASLRDAGVQSLRTVIEQLQVLLPKEAQEGLAPEGSPAADILQSVRCLDKLTHGIDAAAECGEGAGQQQLQQGQDTARRGPVSGAVESFGDTAGRMVRGVGHSLLYPVRATQSGLHRIASTFRRGSEDAAHVAQHAADASLGATKRAVTAPARAARSGAAYVEHQVQQAASAASGAAGRVEHAGQEAAHAAGHLAHETAALGRRAEEGVRDGASGVAHKAADAMSHLKDAVSHTAEQVSCTTAHVAGIQGRLAGACSCGGITHAAGKPKAAAASSACCPSDMS